LKQFKDLLEITEEQLLNKPINPKGILSESIFGPIKQGFCGCNIPFLKTSNEKICPKCNVEDVSTLERAKRFAKIKSPLPFCTLTELTELENSIDGFKEWVKRPKLKNRYLQYDIVDGYNFTTEIENAIIPIKLTSLYTLWLCLSCIELIWDGGPKITENFGYNLIVIPPNSRPSVVSNNTIKFMHDLDGQYNSFISTCNYVSQKSANLDNARYLVLILGCLFPSISEIDIDWEDESSTLIQLVTIMNQELSDINKTNNSATKMIAIPTYDNRFELINSNPLFSTSSPSAALIASGLVLIIREFYVLSGRHLLDRTQNAFKDIVEYQDDIVIPEMQTAISAHRLIQKEASSVFTCMIGLLSGKEGMIRNQFLGKGIDFSARAVICSNMFIKPYEVRIPKQMFVKLFFIEYLSFVFHYKSTGNDELTATKLERLIRDSDNAKDDEMIDRFVDHFFDNDDYNVIDRLVLINRQPTLWRYGIGAIQVIGISGGNAIELNPLCLDPFNADFDGDTCAIYRVHDYTAKIELHENAYIMNTVRYDHNNKFIHTLKDESYFMLKSFTDCGISTDDAPEVINIEFDELALDLNNVELSSMLVLVDGEIRNVGTCLVNIAAGFNKVVIKSDITREDVSRVIFDDSKSNIEYFDRLHNLSVFLNMFGMIIPNETITIPFQECVDINNQSKSSELLNKLPKHPTLGFMIHNVEATKIMDSLDPNSALHRFRQTKFGKTQFARSLVSIGYIANHVNISSGTPVTSSTFGGLTRGEFFKTSFGTRKGITDKQKVTPKSGYLGRTMSMNLSPVSIGEIDCGVEYGLEVAVVNKRHAHSLVRRYYKYHQEDAAWLLLDTTHATEKLIGETIILRSPILCKTDGLRICKHCFGEYDRIPSKYVGVCTGQYLVERITQLSMRTFHSSGSSSYTFTKSLLEFIRDHLKDVINNQYKFTLVFDLPVPTRFTKEMVKSFSNTEHYQDQVIIKENGLQLEFFECLEYENQDVTRILNQVNDSLKVKHKVGYSDIISTYSEQIRNILTLGDIYSTFVEITMCNAYTGVDELKPVRYIIRDSKKVPELVTRRNIQALHEMSSSTLSLLYLPNKNTIMNMSGQSRIAADTPSVFEEIWSGEL